MRRSIFIALIGMASILIWQRPVAAQAFLTYHCRDGAEFVAAFFKNERVARLQLDGKAIVLLQRRSLSEMRYTKGDITLTLAGTVTTLKRGSQSTTCASS